ERENSTAPSYISLVADCSPTLARRWFPCFDEANKKATFQLKVSHPIETTAYSNTRPLSTMRDGSTQITHFAKTARMPTYVVALAITEQPSIGLNADGFELRAVGRTREDLLKTSTEALSILRNFSVFDQVPFIPEKTDIILVEDYIIGAMENPGIIK
ncbi:hypothetical protein PMAYCL1PPCAC_27150, partial [Pristionchus mayeri]